MKSSSIVKDKLWLERQVEAFAAARPTYELFARTVEEILKKAAKKHAPLAIVQVRPKALSSFAEKVQRKINKYDYPLRQITDLCGARVITQTVDQVKAVCRFIEEQFAIDRENSLDVSERLKPAEFGYRSVHYIVSFRSDTFTTPYGTVPIPRSLIEPEPLKAEIQVRTLLEHAWADFAHDTVYKNSFCVPNRLQREFASLAASLERTDASFSRIKDELKSYAEHYDAYMNPVTIRDEIDKLEFALRYDADNLDLVTRIGRLAMAIEDWDRIIALHSRYAQKQIHPILRDLGIALCKKHRASPASEHYRRGQQLLESICSNETCDADTLASYAGTWKGLDDALAYELYRKAYEIDPTNPYPLGNFLDYEIAAHDSIAVVQAMKPILDDAIKKCRSQIDMRLNVPWAFFDMGRFLLLLGKPYKAMAAYAKGIAMSSAAYMLETTLASLERLGTVGSRIQGSEWIRRLLISGLQAKFPSEKHGIDCNRLASGSAPFSGPVLILAGGCDTRIEDRMHEFSRLLVAGCTGFSGTVLSGGTVSGIGACAGEVGKTRQKNVRVIGYLPQECPTGVQKARLEDGYAELREVDAAGFSPLESLQQWIDILASGIAPSSVRLLGFNGGEISAVEYRIALALGATVAVIEGSGGEAAGIGSDGDWHDAVNLLNLPADPAVLAAFLADNDTWESGIRERLGERIHDSYRAEQQTASIAHDPSLAPWDRLNESLRESNRQQADDMAGKLSSTGCSIVAENRAGTRVVRFTEEETESMSRYEHGRWVVERLKDGWRRGSVKDVSKKISPYLVAWEALPEPIRELDRQTTRKMPDFLAAAGLAVERKQK